MRDTIITKEWRSAFVKIEAYFVGLEAVALTAWAFSSLIGFGVIGIVSLAVMTAIVGAMVDDSLVEKANKLIGL